MSVLYTWLPDSLSPLGRTSAHAWRWQTVQVAIRTAPPRKASHFPSMWWLNSACSNAEAIKSVSIAAVSNGTPFRGINIDLTME